MAPEQDPRSLWLGTTRNRKTRNIPTSYIGQTLEHLTDSCLEADCSLLPSRRCYAMYGTPRMAYASMLRAMERGRDYSLGTALRESARSARYVRVGALGDPCILPREEVAETYENVRAEGFRGLLGYTHGWKGRGAHLRGQVMASCDSPEEADRALEMGWRVTVILAADASADGNCTSQGVPVVLCPAQARRGVNCNTCGHCDARARGPPVIGFREHGPRSATNKPRMT
jgi:hypothetical protein